MPTSTCAQRAKKSSPKRSKMSRPSIVVAPLRRCRSGGNVAPGREPGTDLVALQVGRTWIGRGRNAQGLTAWDDHGREVGERDDPVGRVEDPDLDDDQHAT